MRLHFILINAPISKNYFLFVYYKNKMAGGLMQLVENAGE